MLTTLALAPAAILLFFNIASQRAARQQDIQVEAARTGELAALEMQRIVSGLENVMLAVAAAPVVQDFNAAGCSVYLSRLGVSLPQFSSLGVVDANGVVRCRQTAQGLGTSIADRPYFQEALKTGRFVVGDYVIGKVSKKAVLPLALPVRGDSGDIAGVVIGAMDLKWLDARLRERSFPSQGALTIADRDGTIIARQPLPDKFVGTRIPDMFLPLVHADKPGVREVESQDGTRRVIGYFPPSVSRSGLYVSAGLSPDSYYAEINRSTFISLAITILGLVAAYFLAFVTSRQFVGRPVQRLVDTVRSWQEDRTDVRTGMGDRDGELGTVGAAIDRYMDELISSRIQRREAEQHRELLVRELDHRVKNLLATVQAVARQSFSRTADITQSLELFTSRLSAMGDAHQLLMGHDWQAASMDDLITTSIRPFDNPVVSQFIRSGPDFLLQSRAALALGMAIHEMCTNASKYGALRDLSGRIHIDWSVDMVDGQEELKFRWRESDGPPVSEPERKGFGSLMIQRVLAAEMRATVTIDYHPQGVHCSLTAAMADIRASEPDIRPRHVPLGD